MRFLSDNRAQSIQVGAVLLFGILIILLSTWQAFVIPDQNEGIEFNHNEDVQQQMTELRTTVNSMPDSATTRSATVDLGVRYPSRTIFRNPPPVSGTIETRGTTEPGVNISIANAEAAETEAVGTGDFWNGTTRSYSSGAVQYRPSYNQYDNAPTTIYEQSVLYNRFEREGTQLPITDQTIAQDGRLSLVALNGSLSETRVDSTSVDFAPLSTQTREVEIQQDGTEPITIEFPTRMAESRWQELLPSQHTVTTVDGAFPDSERSLLRIELDESRETYKLQMAKVGVGAGTTEPESAYLAGVSGNGTVVERGDSVELTLEIRDEYNRPLSGQEVYADAANGVIDSRGVTGSNGQVTFTYETDSVPTGLNEIDFSINGPVGSGYNEDSPTNVTMVVDVFEPEPDNSQQAYGVRWLSPDDEPGTETCDNETCTLNYTDAQSLYLDMETIPTADTVPIDFGVGDQSIGEVSLPNNDTDGSGISGTTFEPQDNGTVNVYTWGGGSGDVIEVTVENFGVASQAGGLSGAEITDLVPNAGGQMQTVRFTLESDLAEDETVEITLDDAQQASPRQVDYQDGGVNRVTGGSGDASLNANPDTATLTYTAGSSDSEGTTVSVRLESILVGSVDDQNSPYSVDFNRSDTSESVTAPFEVARGSGDARLEDVSLGDIGTTDNEEQTVSFTPTDGLDDGEVVTIDLTDAQQGGVDYGEEGTTEPNDGSVDTFSVDGDVAYINYVVGDDGLDAGSTVEFSITGVSASLDGGTQDTYDVGLSRADGDTAGTTFDVVPMSESVVLTSATARGGDDSIVDFTVENQGPGQAQITGISFDDTTSDAVLIDNGGNDELTFTNGGSYDGGGGNNGIPDDGNERTLDTTEIVGSDDRTTGTLIEFVDSNTGGSSVPMTGEKVTITLYFADGSDQTYTLSL